MRKRLLVVDDNDMISEAVKHHLDARGYEVHCAARVIEAKALLAQSRYGAVITDLQLTPGEGSEGLAIVLEVRRLWPGTPVVLMTGHASETVAIAARRLGVDVLLHKGSSLSELEHVIRRLVGEAA